MDIWHYAGPIRIWNWDLSDAHEVSIFIHRKAKKPVLRERRRKQMQEGTGTGDNGVLEKKQCFWPVRLCWTWLCVLCLWETALSSVSSSFSPSPSPFASTLLSGFFPLQLKSLEKEIFSLLPLCPSLLLEQVFLKMSASCWAERKGREAGLCWSLAVCQAHQGHYLRCGAHDPVGERLALSHFTDVAKWGAERIKSGSSGAMLPDWSGSEAWVLYLAKLHHHHHTLCLWLSLSVKGGTQAPFVTDYGVCLLSLLPLATNVVGARLYYMKESSPYGDCSDPPSSTAYIQNFILSISPFHQCLILNTLWE